MVPAMKNFLITVCIISTTLMTNITLYPAQTVAMRLLPMQLPPSIRVPAKPLATCDIENLKMQRQQAIKQLSPREKPQPIMQLLTQQDDVYIYHLPTGLLDDVSYAAKMKYKITRSSITSETETYLAEMDNAFRIEREKQIEYEKRKMVASLAALSARVRTPSPQPTSSIIEQPFVATSRPALSPPPPQPATLTPMPIPTNYNHPHPAFRHPEYYYPVMTPWGYVTDMRYFTMQPEYVVA